MKSPSSAYITSFNDVTTDNLSECVAELLKKLQKKSHMALDFEFTGIIKQNIQDMNHRYAAMKEAVEKYSIVSFGLSVMKEVNQEDHVYECDNFNFLCKKESKIVFGEGNIEFLASTGFSFDRLNRKGIPFIPPGDIGNEDSASQKPRDTRLLMLWKQIILTLDVNKIPIIVHNGLYDIMYLYHSFIGKLPNTKNAFLSKLSEHFPAGFYDTKVLAHDAEFNASFLSYVFAKSDRLRQNRYTEKSSQYPYYEVIVNEPITTKYTNGAIETATAIAIESVTEETPSPGTLEPTTSTSADRKRKKDEVNTLSITKKQKREEIEICKTFAERGWCNINNNADHSVMGKLHDLQRILDHEMGFSLYPQVYTSDALQMKNMEKAHAAHFDAYMTAFVFCYFLQTYSPETLQNFHNKICINVFPFALPIAPPNKKSK